MENGSDEYKDEVYYRNFDTINLYNSLATPEP